MKGSCEQCMYFEYDEEFDEYGCIMELDATAPGGVDAFAVGAHEGQKRKKSTG